MPMTRSEPITLIHEDGVDLTKKEATRIVATFFDTITEQLAAGGRVELRGFGSLRTRWRGSYEGHNPRALNKVHVVAKRWPHFRPAASLATAVRVIARAERACTAHHSRLTISAESVPTAFDQSLIDDPPK